MSRKHIDDAAVRASLAKVVEREGLRGAARELGFSAPFVGDVLHGRRNLTETLGNALGFELLPPPPTPARVWVRAVTK